MADFLQYSYQGGGSSRFQQITCRECQPICSQPRYQDGESNQLQQITGCACQTIYRRYQCGGSSQLQQITGRACHTIQILGWGILPTSVDNRQGVSDHIQAYKYQGGGSSHLQQITGRACQTIYIRYQGGGSSQLQQITVRACRYQGGGSNQLQYYKQLGSVIPYTVQISGWGIQPASVDNRQGMSDYLQQISG